jgi:hypothetical protein
MTTTGRPDVGGPLHRDITKAASTSGQSILSGLALHQAQVEH